MSLHVVKPENTPWVIPYLTVQDADLAIEFYEKAFNFKLLNKAPGEDGSTWHAEMRYKDQIIMLGKEAIYKDDIKSPTSSGVASPVSLYIYCENVDKLFKHATAAGAISKTEPQDMFWGDRMCSLKDPDGHSWCFATFLGERK